MKHKKCQKQKKVQKKLYKKEWQAWKRAAVVRQTKRNAALFGLVILGSLMLGKGVLDYTEKKAQKLPATATQEQKSAHQKALTDRKKENLTLVFLPWVALCALGSKYALDKICDADLKKHPMPKMPNFRARFHSREDSK